MMVDGLLVHMSRSSTEGLAGLLEHEDYVSHESDNVLAVQIVKLWLLLAVLNDAIYDV